MIFYTADLHLGHVNIIRICKRPFSSIEQMNETLIENWNNVVIDDDTVYILGDFAYRSAVSMKPVLKKLKGRKHLILGNHDIAWIKNIKTDEYFVSVSPMIEIMDGDMLITLCHYPMLSWHKMARGALLIHGHIHNNMKSNHTFTILRNMNAYNAGVDVNEFAPVTLEQLKINKEKFYKEYEACNR